MRHQLVLFLLLVGIGCAVAGCASKDSGNRQFIPGQGWVPA